MCIPQCEDYSYQYVSNPNTRQCEYCGPYCTKCSLSKGCTESSMDNRGYYLSKDNYQLVFPYNTVKQPSSTFQTLQACSSISGSKSRCDSCYNYNSTNCDSCYGYVNNQTVAQQALLGTCNLCTNNTYNNCMQCNTTNSSQCLTCSPGYYLNSSKVCAACNYTGCQRCNTTQCIECKPDYVYNQTTKNCTACTLKTNKNPFQYELQDYRCSQCAGSSVANRDTCAYCDMGYMNSVQSPGICSLKCGTHQYSQVTFNTVNMNENQISSTTCQECPTECTKCLGGDSSTQCTECFSGSYLSITNVDKQSGKCMSKTSTASAQTFDIYVSNLDVDYNRSPTLRTGSSSLPLVDLTDALIRAKELAAPYTNTVKINIYLTSGIHYLRRDRGDSAEIYQPTQYFDPINLNYEIYINPIGCPPDQKCSASMITIINKRREAFVIDIAVKLHMRHIVIDSIDSILPSSTACLGQRRQCCSISSNKVINANTSDTLFNCTQSFNTLKILDLSNSCIVNQPRTLFRMRLNNQQEVIQPNQLILENCEINNIFYDMNSLVNFTSFGGDVQFLNTKFQRISMCGAIVKNYYSNLPLANLSYLEPGNSGLSQIQLNFLTKMRRIQQAFVDTYYQTYFREPSSNPFIACSGTNKCYTLTIKGCTFSYIPFGMTSQTSINLVKSPTSSSSLNNFNQLQNAHTPFNLYQLKALISIQDHDQALAFYNNVFTNNVAFKGIIIIEKSQQQQYPIIFYKNIFTKNAAIIDSNVINIRVKNNINLLGSNYTQASDLQCGGIEINSNTFQSNYGCQQTDGAIMMYCYDQSQSQNSSIVKYITSYDSQYFIGNTGSTALIDGNDKSVQIASAYYNYTYTPYSYTSTTTAYSQTLASNQLWITFKSNAFLSNYAGGDKQIVDIQGFPIVYMESDTFQQNQNYLPNSFTAYSPVYQLQSNKSLPANLTSISQTTLNSYTYKAKSILTLTRALSYIMKNMTFDNNYISDSNLNVAASVKRAQAVLLIDFYGYLTINGASKFQNHVGIKGISFFTSLLSSDIQNGFKTSMINYQRCQFASFVLSNVIFQNNQGYYDTSLSNIPYPYLFRLDISVLSSTYTFTFNYVTLSNNTFYNAYGMIYLDIPTLSIQNSVFNTIGKANDDTSQGLLVIKLNDNYQITITNNTFSDIYTNNLSALYFEQSVTETVSHSFSSQVTLSKNTFTNVMVSSIGSAVVTIESNTQTNWTLGDYSFILNMNDCNFTNIKSQIGSGLVYLKAQTIQSKLYTQNVIITSSNFINITQGNVIQMGVQTVKTSSNFTQFISITSSKFNTVVNGHGIDIDKRTIISEKYVNNQLSLSNNVFTTFGNGSALYDRTFTMTSTSDIINTMAFDSNIYSVISGGSALFFEDSSQIQTVSSYTMILSMASEQYLTISNLGLYYGIQSITTGTYMQSNLSIYKCIFNTINQRAIQIGDMTVSTTGNYQSTIMIETISLIGVGRSPFLIGARTITSKGSFTSNIYVYNTQFNNIDNIYGAISLMKSTINSGNALTNVFSVENCTFAKFASGNGIYFNDQLFTSNSSITDTLDIISSNFSNFDSGSAISYGNLYSSSLGTYTMTLNLKSTNFTVFSRAAAISFGSQTVTSSSAYNRNLFLTSLIFTNINNTAISFGTRNVITLAAYNNAINLLSSQFTNISASGFSNGDQVLQAGTSFLTQISLNNSQFTSVTSNAIDFGANNITTLGDYSYTLQVYQMTFSKINQSSLTFGSNTIVAGGKSTRTIYLNESTFDTVLSQGVNLGGFNSSSSSETAIKLVVKSTVFTSIAKSGFYYGSTIISSTSLYSFMINIADSNFTSIGTNGIQIDTQTISTNSKISNDISLSNANFKSISGSGVSLGALDYTALGSIYQSYSVDLIKMSNVSLYGFTYDSIYIRNTTDYSRAVTFSNSQFTTVNQTAINLPSENVLNSSTYLSQNLFTACIFTSISGAGIQLGSQAIVSQSTYSQLYNFTGNAFTTIGGTGIHYSGTQTATSLSTQSVKFYAQSNNFTTVTLNGLELPPQTLVTNSQHTSIYSITKNIFSAISQSAIVKGAISLTASTLISDTFTLQSNIFTNIGGDGVNIGKINSILASGSLLQTYSILSNTYSIITKNGIYFGQQSISGGSSSIYSSMDMELNTFSAVSMNGIYSEPYIATTTNAMTHTILAQTNTFSGIYNSSFIYDYHSITASSISKTVTFADTTITSNTIGVGINLGRLILTSTTGVINSTLTFSSIDFTNIIGSTNGHGIYIDKDNFISASSINSLKYFKNLNFMNIKQVAIYQNDINKKATGQLTILYDIEGNKFESIGGKAAYYMGNQILEASQSVSRVSTFYDNDFTQVTGGHGIQHLNMTVTSNSDFSNQINLELNTFSTIAGSAFITTAQDLITLNGSYSFQLQANECSISTIQARGILIGLTNVTVKKDITSTILIQNSNFSSLVNQALSNSALTLESLGKITETYTGYNLKFQNITTSSGILFSARTFKSYTQQNSDFNFTSLIFDTISAGRGIYFSNQSLSSNGNITFNMLLNSVLFNNILVGSGLHMSSNFTNINSENGGSSLYINQENSKISHDYYFYLIMNDMLFDNIEKGGAFKYRDYDMYTNNGYYFNADIQSSKIQNIGSGVGFKIIKDMIKSDNTCRNDINIGSNTVFSNISSLYNEAAILIQESFISSQNYYNSNIAISDTIFQTIKQGPTIYAVFNRIESLLGAVVNKFTATDNTYQYLKATSNSSIYVEQNSIYAYKDYLSQIGFSSSLFQNITEGASIGLRNKNITSYSTKSYTQQNTFDYCTFQNLDTNEYASIVQIDKDVLNKDGSDTNTLEFSHCKFTNNTGSLFTSGVYVNSNEEQVTSFDNCTFQYNQGALTNEIYFAIIKSLLVKSSTWISVANHENYAQFIYKNIYDYAMNITGSSFSCGSTYNEIDIMQFYESELLDTASLFNLAVIQEDITAVPTNQFSSNLYTKCNSIYKGAIFKLSNSSQVYDYNGNFTSNSALFGGVAFAENANSLIIIDRPAAVTLNRGYYGGVIYLLQKASAYMLQGIFTKNSAMEGAIIYLLDRCYLKMQGSIQLKTSTAYQRGMIVANSGSWFEISNCLVELNTAYYESVFIHMSDSEDQFFYSDKKISEQERFISSIKYCTIQKNEVLQGGKLINVNYGNLVIQDSKIYKNYIYQDTSGIFGMAANIWINNTVFLEDYKATWYTQFENKLIGDMNGYYINIGRNCTLFVNSSSFWGGRGQYGGCISILGTSKTYIANSSFTSCSAYVGGGIYAVNFDSLTVVNSTFENNVAFRGYSQNIFAQNSKLNLTLIGNKLYSYHNSVFLRDGVLFYLQNNQFLYEPNRVESIPIIEYAGGVHVINTFKITFATSNIFKNLLGANGGAIYITIDINYKNLYKDVYYELDYVSIQNCSANKDGGGIFARNIKKMLVKNSNITQSSALKGNGGGIYFECYESWNDVCSLQLDNTMITGNKANIGGGIKWNWVEVIEEQGCIIKDNVGTLYGQDYASFARELVILKDENEYLKYFNKSSKEKIKVNKTLTQFIYSNVQSGGFIPTSYMALVDDQGQVVTTNSGSMIEFNVQKTKIGNFETEVSGVNKFFSTYGVYNVSGLLIIAAPKSKQSLDLLSVDAVDLNRPSNQNYLKPAYNSTVNITQYAIKIDINIRGCINGEGLRENGACYQCPKGTYLLQPPEEPTECKVCPAEKAICQGGSNIGPQPGYWRKDNETDTFIACFEATSCLGMLPPTNNPVGDCLDGYYGALCSACMPGYSRSGSYACAKCPEPVINILRIVGIIIVLIIVISLMVRGTLNSASKKNTHSVYLKIFMNHLQLLTICAAFKFKWPSQVESFFSSGSVVQSSQESIVSFDCQMDDRDPKSIQKYVFYTGEREMRIVYQKMLIMAGLPVLLATIVGLFWIIVLKKRNQMKHLETKFVATLVILFFLVHPTVTQTMIDMFNCQDFDGDLRMMKDLQIICGTGMHTLMAYGVAAPCIGLWGIGIPASVWFLMKKDKEKLDTLAVKQKFGFLYNGYKRTNFFWEIIIMYRKIGMIGIAVFMNRIGIVVQALVLLILLVAFLQINNMRRPFATRALNDIEDLSLLTGIMTIYCAIFFISSKDPNSEAFNPNQDFYLNNTGQLILFGIIVFANVAFILTWLFKFISVVRLLLKERYQKIYVIVFLCCRQDKLEKENEQLAKITKRETIIEKVEEIQFFLKNMKKMYTRQIFYEGHQRFLKMLYFIEYEKASIDLTEKKHNFYVQGKMARDRKFDPIRMAEILDERVLSIDAEFGGEKNADKYGGPRHSTKKRKSEFQKQGSMISNLRNIAKAKKDNQEDKKSHISSNSDINTADQIVSNLTRSQIRRDVNNQNARRFYQEDMEETRVNIKLNDSSYLLDESQRLDDTSRGLILAGSDNFKSIRRQNYFLDQSSGSGIAFAFSGSGELDDKRLEQQTQRQQNSSEEKQKIKKKVNMEDRLERSRNAKSKLTKQKKHRVYIDEIEGEEQDELNSYQYQNQREVVTDENYPQLDKNSAGLLEFYNNHKESYLNQGSSQQILHTDNQNLDFSKFENIYFNKGFLGQYDSDFLYEESSVREKRLMRGLTRRLKEISKQQNTKKVTASKKSLNKKIVNKMQGLVKAAAFGKKMGNHFENRRKSTGESSQNSKGRIDLSFDVHPNENKKKNYVSGKISMIQPQSIKEASKDQKQKIQQEKQLSVEEVLKMTHMGKEWRKSLNYQTKLRQPTSTKREIMLDNFTCQVRDYNHEHAQHALINNSEREDDKENNDESMDITILSKRSKINQLSDQIQQKQDQQVIVKNVPELKDELAITLDSYRSDKRE